MISNREIIPIRQTGSRVWTLVSAAVFLFIFTPSLRAVTFSTETAQSGAATFFVESAAFDHLGNLHVANRTNNKLYYFKWNGSTWSSQQVGIHNSLSMAIAVDGSGLPRIAFMEGNALFLARYDGSSWVTVFVDNNNVAGPLSLAIDGSGREHLAYYRLDQTLKYAVANGDDWTRTIVDSDGDVGSEVSITVDADRNPHIAYGDSTNLTVKYASHTTTGWFVSTIPGTALPSATSIAVDGYGRPRIAYQDSSGTQYASYDGASWTVSNVMTGSNYYGTLALDGDGIAHLGFARFVGPGFQIVYASGTDVSWSTTTVDNVASFTTPSMALDASGRPHFFYDDSVNSQLKAAHGLGTGGGTPPMGGNARGRVQAAVGLSGTAEISTITWNWTDNASDESGYRIYVASEGSSNYILLADSLTLVANSNSFLQAGLTVNTSYQAYVETVADGGIVDSAVAFRATLAAKPSTTTFTSVAADSIDLDWEPNGNPEPGTSYQVWESTDINFVNAITTTVTTSAASFTDLLTQTTHYFKVRALNLESVPSPFDTTVSTKTLVSLDAVPPGVITDVAQQAWSGTVNEINIGWTTTGDDDSSGVMPNGSEYRIQYSSDDPDVVVWSTSNAQIVISTSGLFPGTRVGTSFLVDVPRIAYRVKIWTKDETSNYSIGSDTVIVRGVPFVSETIRSAVAGVAKMVVDQAGDFHALFSDSGGLSYMTHSGGSWSAPTVIESDSNYGAIALDADARPHVAFYTTPGHILKYAHFDGVTWSTTTIDDSGDDGGTSSIVVDAAGHVYISYFYLNGDSVRGLKYAFFDGNTWTINTLAADNGSGIGGDSTIVLNAASQPRIFCNPALYYWFDGSRWDNYTIGNIYTEPSFEIDGYDQAHVTSHTMSFGFGFLFYHTGGGGAFDQIDPLGGGSSQNFGAMDSLALDGNGHPRVASLIANTGTLRYGSFDGTNWTAGDANLGGANVNQSVSLVIDAAGDPQIFYFSATGNVLKRASWTGENGAKPMSGGRGLLQSPTGMASTVLSTTSVRYNWTDNASDEWGYQLYGSVSSTGPYTLIADTSTLAPNANTYTETGMTGGATYYRYVVAINAGGFAFSKQVSTYLPSLNVPGNFAGAVMGISSITWSWSDVSDEAGYRVASLTQGILSPDLPPNTTSWNETGLSTNTAYARYVASFSGFGASSSTVFTRYTLAASPAPTSPTFLSVGPTTLAVEWNANTNPIGVTTYTVVASTDSSSPNGSSADVSISTMPTGASPSAFLTSLSANTTYFLFVRAVNGDGIPTAFVLMGSTPTLAASPTNLSFTAISATALTIAWQDTNNGTGTLYDVAISTDPNPAAPAAGSVVTSSRTPSLTFSLGGLSVNVTYYADVAAVNHSGIRSTFAGAVATATLANPPIASTFTAVEISSLTFAWNNNGNPAGTSYLAEISADNFSSVLSSSGTVVTTATFNSLGGNSTYYVRVRAANQNGISTSLDTTLSTVTSPATPLSQPPSNVTSSSFTVNWLANGNSLQTRYDVVLSTDNFATVSSVVQTTDTFASFTGLSANTTYYSEVRAVGNSGILTAYAVLPDTQTLLMSPGLASPVFLEVDISSLTVQWTAGGNSAGTTYDVDIATTNLFSPLFSNTSTLSTSVTFGNGGVAPDLNANTTYYVRVKAAGGGNVSAPVVLGSTATYAQPPTGLLVTAVTSTTITVDWSPNGNPEPGTRYELWQDTTNAFAAPTKINLSTSTAQLSNLQAGATYFLQVRALGNNGAATTFSNVVSTRTAEILVGNGQITSSGGTFTFNLTSVEVTVDVPANAFDQTVAITVNTLPSFPAPNSHAVQLQGTGIGVEFVLTPEIQPTNGVTISFDYSPALIQTLGLNESALAIARYDDVSGGWLPLQSTVDTTLHRVTAVTHHFSTFQLLVSIPATSVEHLVIYPNPLRPAAGHRAMNFTNAPAGATIRIFSSVGDLIATRTADDAGLASWNGTNDDGRKAASGVYYAVVDGAGGKTTYRVAVQR